VVLTNDLELMLQEVYSLRVRRGIHRQPTQKGNLQTLCGFVKNGLGSIPPSPSHPYELNIGQLELLADQLVNCGGQCAGVPVELLDVDHVYRIASPKDLTNSSGWYKDDEKTDAETAWTNLKNEYDNREDLHAWLPLADYASGPYRGLFNFSWWTPHEPTGEVFPSAHKMGMFSNWVASLVFLLRCKVKDAEPGLTAFVPTVVDAFPQSVFHPMKDTPKPAHGLAIDLSSGPSLTTGVEEFVLAPIEVSHIDVRPLKLEANTRLRYVDIDERSTQIWEALLSYYKVL